VFVGGWASSARIVGFSSIFKFLALHQGTSLLIVLGTSSFGKRGFPSLMEKTRTARLFQSRSSVWWCRPDIRSNLDGNEPSI